MKSDVMPTCEGYTYSFDRYDSLTESAYINDAGNHVCVTVLRFKNRLTPDKNNPGKYATRLEDHVVGNRSYPPSQYRHLVANNVVIADDGMSMTAKSEWSETVEL